MITTQKDLRAERRRLSAAEFNAYSPEHFPGSRKWLAHQAAIEAVNAFDREHPEIIAAIEAERESAAPPSWQTDPGSHYNRALRMED